MDVLKTAQELLPRSLRCVQTVDEENDYRVSALCLSADGHLGLLGSSDGRLMLWDVMNGQCIKKFQGKHTTTVTSVTMSRDGSLALSGSGPWYGYGELKDHALKYGMCLLDNVCGHSWDMKI